MTTILAMAGSTYSTQARTPGKKILVAWYSWGGNTETVGNYIRELTDGDVFVIEPADPYPADYRECTEVAKTEINAGCKRAIKGPVPDLRDYDVVILGTPNWWSTMAPPVLSFLTESDLSGKTVAPFVTHGGGREARCFADMRANAAGAEFVRGFVVSGNRARSSKADVEAWLKETGIL